MYDIKLTLIIFGICPHMSLKTMLRGNFKFRNVNVTLAKSIPSSTIVPNVIIQIYQKMIDLGPLTMGHTYVNAAGCRSHNTIETQHKQPEKMAVKEPLHTSTSVLKID